MRKRILVTGGLGFLGSYLVEFLLKDNHIVIVLDNKTSNVVDETFFSKQKNFSFIDSNIQEINLEIIGKVDIVFHLACVVGPSGILRYAAKMGQMIIDDTMKLVKFCHKNNAIFIDISTSEIYGHTNILREDSPKIFPGEYNIRTEYGAGKMLAELMTCNYSKINEDFKYHIIRPFNITGERQKPNNGFVLPRFVIAALTDQPITVFNEGIAVRAFTSVKDMRDWILKIAFSDLKNEIWNIGNPENKISIIELARKVAYYIEKRNIKQNIKIVNVDPRIIHGNHFSEAVDKLPYIEKFKKHFGFTLNYSYNDIINEVIDFYAEKVNNGYFFDVYTCSETKKK